MARQRRTWISEMANRNGNGNDGGNVPARSRRITADDLSKAAEAAREAAQAASNAAEAVVVALESGGIDQVLQESQAMPASEEPDSGQSEGGGEGGESRVAFEEFMAQLSGILRKAGDQLSVTEHARWVKIESKKNGHKIYVAKGKNQVNRIESTLGPELVPGATEPDRKNGRIASLIPADPKAVSIAIRRLVQSEDQLRPPQRGAMAEEAGAAEEQQSGGGGGGRGRGGRKGGSRGGGAGGRGGGRQDEHN